MRVTVCHTLWLFILPLFSWHCKKSGDQSAVSITGYWELRETSVAMHPGEQLYAPGNGHILHFTGDRYVIYQSGLALKSGQYVTVRDSTVEASVCLVFPKGQFTSRIIYDSDYTAIKTFYDIENNTLTFYSGCYAYDAGQREVYARVSIGQ